MKLVRMYSNKGNIFEPISFNSGFSAVLADIRVPENKLLDTHNLGKTTVGELIDFCLLRGRDAKFFLFKHQVFENFTFFLEIQLGRDSYMTIGRSVKQASKVDIKRSGESIPDITALTSPEWDHSGLAFERARSLLDGTLGIEALRPWGFRKIVGYLIRSQKDYLDVFQLNRFAGKHSDWKPFVAHLLGMQAQPVIDLYAKREEQQDAANHLKSIQREWGGEDADPSVLDGLISVKRREVAAKKKTLDSFDFQSEDKGQMMKLVASTESGIATLNEEAYRLVQLNRSIEKSLDEDRILFKTTDAEQLFTEAGVLFPEQLKRDFDQLISFNRAITKERKNALRSQQEENASRIREIQAELDVLNEQRARSLHFLRSSDSLDKYKTISVELTTQEAELGVLEARREAVGRLLELRRQQRTLQEQRIHLMTVVERQIEQISQDEESRFGQLRRYFVEIISEVLGRNAIIAIKMNGEGGLEFIAEFIDDTGTATSDDRGTSYKKLLCIAFDLAMLRTYLDMPFPRFVYHDGALETLDPRKREKLIGVFRRYSTLGIQPIISLLDSDRPQRSTDSSLETITDGEIILTLHDEDQSGRLFKMPTW